ncbi:hydrolase 1, exosortase A system-associated [Rubrivivax albus]|uniref:Hydrolase 1, exosortase A system-associated n=1 Tax=Rubrivivax albus TaxID=2499835 RepID=A0A437JZH1_9BURK|nr:hydrolase 1, exosortase A system-associated [Rubrivivax albus]RVT53470.1 hydrolase 1, exosortase A system-associated [Rubrivivax albus]
MRRTGMSGHGAFSEEALSFDCAGERLVGIAAVPKKQALGDIAVLIVVGGPQVRIGSHRHFVQLARTLASNGVPTLRFDVRGMGDSSGERRDFTQLDDDIEAGISTLQRHCPEVRRVVLWGLCDGASASLLYLFATGDARVAGLVLLNPWVRSAETLARANVKHYYRDRLKQPEFWRKLLSGQVAAKAVAELIGNLRTAMTRPGGADRSAANSRPGPDSPFTDRMLHAARLFDGPMLFVLSGRDYTAKEFLETVSAEQRWQDVLGRATTTTCHLPDADHTFSAPEHASEVDARTLQWLQGVCGTQDAGQP